MDTRMEDVELKEYVVKIRRVAKVVKGGKRLRFSVLVVVGDGKGRVGIGMGKSHGTPEAIQKALKKARKNMVKVPIVSADTIPHPIIGKMGATEILLKPAAEGTGVIAGNAARAVLEAAGIRNILTKVIGSTNPINVAKATLNGLKSLRDPRELARLRGKPLKQIWPFELKN